ncbi:MAG: nucleotidyltransferase family protein [Proteobacteria bacterium]|nr:nucleotidyltransferase family protein [Pseudomonadota bacterium]
MKADLAVVLAAGGSRRMGRPKARLSWDGAPLVLAHVAALGLFAREVVVVTGAEPLEDLLDGISSVHNAEWERSWPSDSLRLALAARPSATCVLVTPVDVVPAQPDTLRALLGRGSVVPTDPEGLDGHPVVVAGAALDLLRRGPVPGGLRSVLRDADRVSVSDRASALDFDDLDAWHAVRRAAIGH